MFVMLILFQNFVGNIWSVTSREGPDRLPPRTLHATAYDEDTDTLFVHGGFDLNTVLGDFWSYSFKTNEWNLLSTSNVSSKVQLEGHKMVRVADGLLMFGGKRVNGSYSNTLWFYNFTLKTWHIKAENSKIKPKPVWLHTLTLVQDFVYVFGGSTVGGEFVSDMFRISKDSLD